jgi:hypothetical protein
MRRFELHRTEDVSGVSGTGVVAQGVEFDDGVCALRWLTDWPTSVVFHDRGADAVEHVHGHNGRTEVVWLDSGSPPPTPAPTREQVASAVADDIDAILNFAGDTKTTGEIAAFVADLLADLFVSAEPAPPLWTGTSTPVVGTDYSTILAPLDVPPGTAVEVREAWPR